jgi:hypothetical protein
MTDLASKFNIAQCDAWTVYNLLNVLFEALPDDATDALPVRCTLSHIMDLAKALPNTIERIEREVNHG